MKKLEFSNDWEVLQDVHDQGEQLKLFSNELDLTNASMQFSQWESIERLTYLQILFSQNPYFGRELRYFNNAPWWYRYEFSMSEDELTGFANLEFQGVDYYCRVWLNGEFLGEHEGYQVPFSFEVGSHLRKDKNFIIVKVWSPWDSEIKEGCEESRTFMVKRNMIKGTYEHDDTFIQRDVNPVGIFRGVNLKIHSGIIIKDTLQILTQLSDEGSNANVTVNIPISSANEKDVELYIRILYKKTNVVVYDHSEKVHLDEGLADINMNTAIQNPELWNTWDRGSQGLYILEVDLACRGVIYDSFTTAFGVKTINLVRTKEETTYYLNGKKIFIRGTSYFPDVYISEMSFDRYLRDLKLIKNAGFNAIRLHVHTPNEELYDICNELGLAVFHDFEVNWVQVESEDFIRRAVKLCTEIIVKFRNHPSLFTWICTNEPSGGIEGYIMMTGPAQQLYNLAQSLDPKTPAIKASGSWLTADEHECGDTHNYTGSLCKPGSKYTDITDESCEKFNSEFGFDAPGCFENLMKTPKVYAKIKELGIEGLKEIQYYQYRLLKYYIEHYRTNKYMPCTGYFQFMFIDLCPQSFYGLYDWWGYPKEGLKAILESNQPICLILEKKENTFAIKIINDFADKFEDCTLEWYISNSDDAGTEKGESKLDLSADSVTEAVSVDFDFDNKNKYDFILILKDKSGKTIAQNRYKNAFNHPTQPKGHPARMSHELGMRLYWL